MFGKNVGHLYVNTQDDRESERSLTMSIVQQQVIPFLNIDEKYAHIMKQIFMIPR